MKNIIKVLFLVSVLNNTYANENKSSFYSKNYQKKALEIYSKLISFRTVTGHGEVPAITQYLANEFSQAGFADEDINILPFKSNKGEDIAGLVVRYHGDGSANKSPILLVAHMDIVEALPKDWKKNPYTLIEEDGFFFGRGTMDNKNGVAELTATFLRLKSENFVPTRDLIIAFSGDEESGMLSIDEMVNTHRDLTNAEFALNSDDGGGGLDHEKNAISYWISAAEKTYASYELTIRNPGGHSSTPRADNAIYQLANVLNKLEAYRFPVRYNDITLGLISASAQAEKGELAEALLNFSKDPTNKKAANYLFSQPTYVGITRTTCVATMLSAGHAENALPQSATATVNCRIFPGIEPSDIMTKLQLLAGKKVEIAMLGNPQSSPASQMRDDVTQAVTKAVLTQYPGTVIMPAMVPWATDGNKIRAAGIPTYGVSGDFIREEDAFAHGLNERLPVKSFYSSLEHWYLIIIELAGNKESKY